MSGPKTLAERFEWMASNLPGFREELKQVNAVCDKAKCFASNPPASSDLTDPVPDEHPQVLPVAPRRL